LDKLTADVGAAFPPGTPMNADVFPEGTAEWAMPTILFSIGH
jgi:hypothetical protein